MNTNDDVAGLVSGLWDLRDRKKWGLAIDHTGCLELLMAAVLRLEVDHPEVFNDPRVQEILADDHPRKKHSTAPTVQEVAAGANVNL